MSLSRWRWQKRRMRWLSMLLPFALLFGMLGRGHVFQMLGLAIACAHPDEARAERQAADDAPDGASRRHDHCPPDCHRCPCGQMPVMPAPYNPLEMTVVEFQELPAWLVADEPGQFLAYRLDRPPRQRIG